MFNTGEGNKALQKVILNFIVICYLYMVWFGLLSVEVPYSDPSKHKPKKRLSTKYIYAVGNGSKETSKGH